jgi:hypothetical protein
VRFVHRLQDQDHDEAVERELAKLGVVIGDGNTLSRAYARFDV